MGISARRLRVRCRPVAAATSVQPRHATLLSHGGVRQAKTYGVQALETFAVDLQQDAASARAALTSGWSSGQSESHASKLKLFKRRMCGRAKFDLLRV